MEDDYDLRFDMDLQLPPVDELFVIPDDVPHMGEITISCRKSKLRELVDVIFDNRAIDPETMRGYLDAALLTTHEVSFLLFLLPIREVMSHVGERKTKHIMRYFDIPGWPYRGLRKLRIALRAQRLDRETLARAVEEIVFCISYEN